MTTDRSMEQQVRRLLARDGMSLVKPRAGGMMATQYGPYYIVDTTTNSIGMSGLSLEEAYRYASTPADA